MVQFPVRARDFSLLQIYRPTLGYVWAPIQCEPGRRVSSLGVKQLGCEADHYLHLVPTLRMSVALPTCPPYAFMACTGNLRVQHVRHIYSNTFMGSTWKLIIFLSCINVMLSDRRGATLQNFVKPETTTYQLTQTAIEHTANHRSLDSPIVSKMDKYLL
jgi:hypothetical protein